MNTAMKYRVPYKARNFLTEILLAVTGNDKNKILDGE